MTDKKVCINGINAETGQYMTPPLEYDQLAALIKGEKEDKKEISQLRRIWGGINQRSLGLPINVQPENMKQAGWGMVFHRDEAAEVKAALTPLYEHRRQQIQNNAIVHTLEYRDGEDPSQWLARHGVGAGSVVPEKVPYYLLLIGSPERIPFSFCHHLDVEYAVGWLHFDSVTQYKQYVESLISYETTESVPSAKEAVFFGTRHNFDRATQMSADLLVKPLADGETAPDGSTTPGVAQRWGFRSRKIWGDAATKTAFSQIFTSEPDTKPPALLFTATHGMGMPKGHSEQQAVQGALLCQDWPGLGTVGPDHYFKADELPAESRIHGLVSFHFACYGAGTPEKDRFIHKAGQQPPAIANKPFLASLPKALLAHPGGGALACIGHVERAWGYSIVSPNAGPQLLPFQNALGRIMLGQPVGHAMKDFNERYAALSVELSGMLEKIGFGDQIPDNELAAKWIARNDAEGYIIMGDPAVRLRVDDIE